MQIEFYELLRKSVWWLSLRSQENSALAPKVSSKSAQYWRKELRPFLLPFCRNTGIWMGTIMQTFCAWNYARKLTAVVGSQCVDTPWKRKISYRTNYKDSFHRLQVGSLSHPASLSGYESSVFRSLRETERNAAWPKISVFRNMNSTVIRRKRQLSGQLNGSQIYPMAWCHVDKIWNFTYHNMPIKITRSWLTLR